MTAAAGTCPVCGHPETVHGAGGYPTCVDCGGRCTAPPRTEPETLVEFLHARLGEDAVRPDELRHLAIRVEDGAYLDDRLDDIAEALRAAYECDIRVMDVCEAAIEGEQPGAQVAEKVLDLMAKRYENHPGYRAGQWKVMW